MLLKGDINNSHRILKILQISNAKVYEKSEVHEILSMIFNTGSCSKNENLRCILFFTKKPCIQHSYFSWKPRKKHKSIENDLIRFEMNNCGAINDISL